MKPIRLFCSDLDGTLLGNPEATGHFKRTWESFIGRQRPLLCYNSGRLIDDVLHLLQIEPLPKPDYIIAGVGTQLYDVKRMQPVAEFNQQFRAGWDLAKVEEILASTPGVTRQPPEFLHPYKSSWYLPQATPEVMQDIRKRLADAGLEVSVIYSSARDLDVLPADSSKGHALKWLCDYIGMPLDRVLVAGDSGNDSSMFRLPGVRGIVVENAQPELYEAVVDLPIYSATRVFAEGVLQGLAHFDVIGQTPSLDRPLPPAAELDPALRRLFSQQALSSLTATERELIADAYRRALTALRKNITPIGFSACSLDDNEVTGVDVNYRSVWARDGCMTIIDTIGLPDADIREAQVATLRTLFDHIAPNGQIPANVRIETGEPDYSGTGGICAIDSGPWAAVALYVYVRKYEDWDLLQKYAEPLDRMMTWLRALDSNNDGLLEIPEAGDWTDLFGRSYHILFDEVLWYRAAIVYGRLLEFQKRFEEAAAWLRRAQTIRSKILRAFWPSTKPLDPSRAHQFRRAAILRRRRQLSAGGNHALQFQLALRRARQHLRLPGQRAGCRSRPHCVPLHVGRGRERTLSGRQPLSRRAGRRSGLAGLLHGEPAQSSRPLPQRRDLAVHRWNVGAFHPPLGSARCGLPRTAEAGAGEPPGQESGLGVQ